MLLEILQLLNYISSFQTLLGVIEYLLLSNTNENNHFDQYTLMFKKINKLYQHNIIRTKPYPFQLETKTPSLYFRWITKEYRRFLATKQQPEWRSPIPRFQYSYKRA